MVNNKVFLSPDQISANNEQAPLRKYHKETGQLPFWNPYSFAGMPSFESLTYTPYGYRVARNSIQGLIGFLAVMGIVLSLGANTPNLLLIFFPIHGIIYVGSYIHDIETLIHILPTIPAGLMISWLLIKIDKGENNERT